MHTNDNYLEKLVKKEVGIKPRPSWSLANCETTSVSCWTRFAQLELKGPQEFTIEEFPHLKNFNELFKKN